MLAYILAHYKDILLAVLAIDAALIPIFPQVGLLGAIKSFIGGILGSDAPKA